MSFHTQLCEDVILSLLFVFDTSQKILSQSFSQPKILPTRVAILKVNMKEQKFTAQKTSSQCIREKNPNPVQEEKQGVSV